VTAVDTPILIVGGGGAGLTASMLLSKLGVESLGRPMPALSQILGRAVAPVHP
jgi:hypothetical protein